MNFTLLQVRIHKENLLENVQMVGGTMFMTKGVYNHQFQFFVLPLPDTYNVANTVDPQLSCFVSFKSTSCESYLKYIRFRDLSGIKKPLINLNMNARAYCCLSMALAELSTYEKLSSNYLISIRLPLNLFGTLLNSWSQIAIQSPTPTILVTIAPSIGKI